MTNVIGVSASARINKNTADLLKLALQTLEKKGLETKLIQLAEHKILPCQACDYECLFTKEKNCPIKDDVPKIWKQICNANAVIYGVPVYSGTIPALLKILFDRSQSLELPTHTQTIGIIILGTYGHLNVLAALAPCLIYYPHFRPVGYAMAIGWQKAIQNEKTRQQIIQLAENIYRETSKNIA